MPNAGGGSFIFSSAQINPGVVESSDIKDATIVDADVNAAAAIAGSKLQALSVGSNAGVLPSTGLADSHVAAAAAIAGSKIQALAVGSNAGVLPSTGLADAHVAASAAIAQSKLSLSITDAEVNASAAIADTKLAQITTASKVSGAALTNLANIPAGAGVIPAANLPAGATVDFPGTQVASSVAISTSFQNLDLSSVVGSNRALVLISMVATGGDSYFWAREDGNTGNDGSDQQCGPAGGGGRADAAHIWVMTNASGVIEVKSSVSSINFNAWVEAYIKA